MKNWDESLVEVLLIDAKVIIRCRQQDRTLLNDWRFIRLKEPIVFHRGIQRTQKDQVHLFFNGSSQVRFCMTYFL